MPSLEFPHEPLLSAPSCPVATVAVPFLPKEQPIHVAYFFRMCLPIRSGLASFPVGGHERGGDGLGDSLECNVCHRRTETVVLHSEGVPAYRELSLHDGMTWPLHSCRSNPNPFPQPVLLAQTDPRRLVQLSRCQRALLNTRPTDG